MRKLQGSLGPGAGVRVRYDEASSRTCRSAALGRAVAARHHRRVLDSLSPARRRFVLALVAMAAAAAVVVVAIVIAVNRQPAVVPVSQSERGPVLIVPGYGGSTTALAALVAALEAAGRDVTVVPPVGDGTGDLDTQAQALDAVATSALARTGTGSVDVVGYSAGGVVARLWVRDHGGGSVARRVLTLGSPHHGTDLAGVATDLTPDTCPEACLQLAPGSDFLNALNSGDETPDGPLWVSIWTADDKVVTPPSSAELDDALNFSVQSICPGVVVTHSGLPRLGFVIAATVNALEVATPSLPTRRECR